MFGTKLDGQSWRDFAATRSASSEESRSGAKRPAVVSFSRAPVESSAWDPYEVWLTRVKQPRDARERSTK
jgi:hypothetical protein